VTALRGLTRFNAIGFRCMSVTTISDLEATEKFTETNPKSVLYFTATWYVPFKIEVNLVLVFNGLYPEVF